MFVANPDPPQFGSAFRIAACLGTKAELAAKGRVLLTDNARFVSFTRRMNLGTLDDKKATCDHNHRREHGRQIAT